MKNHYGRMLLLVISILVFAGCASVPHAKKTVITREVTLAPGQTVELPTPDKLGFDKVTATQILTAEYQVDGRPSSYTTQVQIEKTPKRLVLVAVAGWGGEIFSIDYQGEKIDASSLPMPNSSMGIQHVLSDFIFTYAPDTLLKTLLKSTDIRLVIKKNERQFLLKDKPILTIQYQYNNPWKGNVVLHNAVLNYTIKISTISFSNGK